MSKRKHINTDDLDLINKMSSFLVGKHNEIVMFCEEECPYFSSCRDFAGACAIQTVKSVANWGWRILCDQQTIIQKRIDRQEKLKK